MSLRVVGLLGISRLAGLDQMPHALDRHRSRLSQVATRISSLILLAADRRSVTSALPDRFCGFRRTAMVDLQSDLAVPHPTMLLA
jgi:hypothetical protein